MSLEDLDQEQKECLGFITREPGISSEQLYDKMCIGRKEVSLVIFQLSRLGLIYKGSFNGRLGYIPVNVSETEQVKHDAARNSKVAEKLKPVEVKKEPVPAPMPEVVPVVPKPQEQPIPPVVDKVEPVIETKPLTKTNQPKLPNGNFTRNTVNGTIALFLYLNRIKSYTIDEIVTRLAPVCKKATSIPASVYMMASNGALTSTKSPIKGRQYTWGYKYNYPFNEMREEDKTYIPELNLFGDLDELKLSLVTMGKDTTPTASEEPTTKPVGEMLVHIIDKPKPSIAAPITDVPTTIPSPGLDEMLMNQTVIANHNALTLIESRIASIELELKHLYVLKTTLTNKK